MKEIQIDYQDQSTTLESTIVYREDHIARKPVICIFPTWSGKDDFTTDKAYQIAKMGYVGCVVDMYGKGRSGRSKEECSSLMNPLIEDRQLLKRRAMAGFLFAQSLPFVNPNQIGAIGFCFGGLCALDLARSGADVKAVVSFHGLLNPPNKGTQPIKSKILALHGDQDPMVSGADLLNFKQEMDNSKVDWQLHIFGGAMHAFTNPKANDPEFGTVYHRISDQRSWNYMQLFFSEIFNI
jgi:dienelactone hydrolase